MWLVGLCRMAPLLPLTSLPDPVGQQPPPIKEMTPEKKRNLPGSPASRAVEYQVVALPRAPGGTSGCPVTLPLLVLLAGPFGTLDPFGSGSFSSAEGFADFSQMSKVKPLPHSTHASARVLVPFLVLSWLPDIIVNATCVFPLYLSNSEMHPHTRL